MALKALDIFKLTPKKNCNECGFPTCMAFSMKVASGAVEVSDCPQMAPEAIAKLVAATAPPMKSEKVGTGNIATGKNRTVDFRYEVVKIIKSSRFYEKSSSNEIYFYPNIPEKRVINSKRYISEGINPNAIAVIIDTSIFSNGKEGCVFTTTGVYFKQMLMKKNYFNYMDIKKLYYDNPYIAVELKNGQKIDISVTEYYMNELIDVLKKLKQYAIDNDINSKRESGVLKKVNMTEDLTNKCHVIIHGASVAAGGAGAGLAQLPCSDAAVISPIQIGMIVALGSVFDMEITNSTAKAVLSGMTGAFVGRGIVQIAVGWIPGAGNLINTATAAGLTEAIGWMAANQFYNESLDNISKYSYEGEKRGYEHASEMYEKKLRQQAEMFLNQQQVFSSQRHDYENLLDEYKKYIQKLEHELANKNEIIKMKNIYYMLSNLRDA